MKPDSTSNFTFTLWVTLVGAETNEEEEVSCNTLIHSSLSFLLSHWMVKWFFVTVDVIVKEVSSLFSVYTSISDPFTQRYSFGFFSFYIFNDNLKFLCLYYMIILEIL